MARSFLLMDIDPIFKIFKNVHLMRTGRSNRAPTTAHLLGDFLDVLGFEYMFGFLWGL